MSRKLLYIIAAITFSVYGFPSDTSNSDRFLEKNNEKWEQVVGDTNGKCIFHTTFNLHTFFISINYLSNCYLFLVKKFPKELKLELNGVAKEKQSSKMGVYLLQNNLINEQPYWINTNGKVALWYVKHKMLWIFGNIQDLGKNGWFHSFNLKI